MPIQPTSVRLPTNLKRWLAKLAKSERRSMTGMIVELLEQERDRRESAARLSEGA